MVKLRPKTPLCDKKCHAEFIQDMLKIQENHTKNVKNQKPGEKKKSCDN